MAFGSKISYHAHYALFSWPAEPLKGMPQCDFVFENRFGICADI